MLKLMIFIKKKDGITFSEFVDHYEKSHAPLISRHLSEYFTDYRRNFINHDDEYNFEGTFDRPGDLKAPPAFDVITEIWFDSRSDLVEMYKVLRTPEIALEVAQDEEKFMDRQSLKVLIANEYQS